MGKKQTARDQLYDDFEIKEGQVYARSLGPQGNHQHQVEFMDGEIKLVTLPPRFRNVVWLKRGNYIIVDRSVCVSEKVAGEIVHLLFPKNIKDLKAAGKWPKKFSDTQTEPTTAPSKSGHHDADGEEEEEEGEEDDENQDDLFVNNNRPIMYDTDSSEDDE